MQWKVLQWVSHDRKEGESGSNEEEGVNGTVVVTQRWGFYDYLPLYIAPNLARYPSVAHLARASLFNFCGIFVSTLASHSVRRQRIPFM